jgi:hypothetical protein
VDADPPIRVAGDTVSTMSDAPSIWEDELPVGTKLQITYSNGKHRDGIILEHRSDGLLKLATNRNPALGGVFFANTAHITEIEIIDDQRGTTGPDPG